MEKLAWILLKMASKLEEVITYSFPKFTPWKGKGWALFGSRLSVKSHQRQRH